MSRYWNNDLEEVYEYGEKYLHEHSTTEAIEQLAKVFADIINSKK